MAQNGFTRRDLLAASGIALAPLAGLAAEDAERRAERVSTHGRLPAGHALDADVVVVGGGMAGVCAALAAARNGASVVLVQDRSVLGGNASSEVRMHCVGADGSGRRRDTDARESGIIEEFRLEDAVWNPQRSASMWDLLLYNAVRSETNIRLLLHTHCCGVRMAGEDRIAA
ncbi:MAG: FAD-dependent oxidoreductase, partial [Planctomycetes bacterium]|nr:FAD-dependent oxidoreductase [Planctomycetota bacterium]